MMNGTAHVKLSMWMLLDPGDQEESEEGSEVAVLISEELEVEIAIEHSLDATKGKEYTSVEFNLYICPIFIFVASGAPHLRIVDSARYRTT